MNRLSNIIFLFIIITGLPACFRVEGDLFDAETSILREGLTVYLKNTRGLGAETMDQFGNLAWIYSDFDADGQPVTPRAVSFRSVSQDTRYHLLLDDRQRVRYLFATRSNGDLLPAVVRFDYPSGASTMVFLFSIGSDQQYTLEWQVEVRQSGSDPVSLPVYVRDECGDVQRIHDGVDQALSTLERVFAAAFLTTPDWLRTDALSAVRQLLDLLANACQQPTRTTLAGPDPTRVPDNPNDRRSTLESQTSARPCSGAGTIAFEVERLSNGQARFVGVSGGQAPYSFSLGGSAWQNDPLFAGDFPAGPSYLMAVRSAGGCISARIDPITRVSAQGKIARVSTRQRQAGQPAFQPGREYTFQYDNLGRLAMITSPGIPSDNQPLRYTYGYDAQGRLSRYSREKGSGGAGTTTMVQTFSYTGEGLISAITETMGGVSGQYAVSYDAAGRVSRLQMAGGDVIYSYDSRQNLIRLQETYISGESTTYTYAYSVDAPNPLVIFPDIFEPLHGNFGGSALTPLLVTGQESPNRLNRVRRQQANGNSSLSDYYYQTDAGGRLQEVRYDAVDGSAEVLALEYVN